MWEEKIDAILGPGPHRAMTARTLTTRADLLADLATVRQRGYAMDDEEYETDLRCLAAPIRDVRGDVVAALSISALASRLRKDDVAAVAATLIRAADDITIRLGGQPPRASHAPAAAADALFFD
jgi:IclR family acetate operon transcriptional repressor